MARVFVSYSRKNTDFARRLAVALEKQNFDLWVDWEDIPPTVDWSKEIEKGIEEADTFLFIISPDSITSKVCKQELEHAVKNGKRLIPVVPIEVKWDDVPSQLSHLNYIFFRETDDFNAALEKLLTALDTDYDWMQTHRRLQVKALEWERGSKDKGFLLRGIDLENAEQQISVNANKDPHPTDLQRAYVLKSRQETTRQDRVRTGALSVAVIVMLGIIIALIKPYIEEWNARREAQGVMLPILAGEFVMGATDPAVVETGERAEWATSLPAFKIEKYEVTNRQYNLCVVYGPCVTPGNPKYFYDPDKRDYPVLSVNVYQANAYCRWLGHRLPKELEWVRAARGLDDRRLWPWGDTIEPLELLNMPVYPDFETDGAKSVLESNSVSYASPEGVENMIGNALEWTSSYYQPVYSEQGGAYDPDSYWHGDDDTFDGSKTFIRLGGGWGYQIYHLTQEATENALNTDSTTGMRCASD